MSQQIYSVVVAYNVGGQFAQNVLHYQFDDSGYSSTFAAAEALANAWAAHCLSPLGLMLPVSTAILSVKTRKVTGVGGFEALNLFAAGTHGARTGALEVAAVGPVIITYQALNGKKRGRIFLPGITETDADSGVISPALKTVMNTNMVFLIDNLTLVGGGAPVASAVIYNRTSHSGVLIGGVAFSLTLGTQRRRQLPF